MTVGNVNIQNPIQILTTSETWIEFRIWVFAYVPEAVFSRLKQNLMQIIWSLRSAISLGYSGHKMHLTHTHMYQLHKYAVFCYSDTTPVHNKETC